MKTETMESVMGKIEAIAPDMEVRVCRRAVAGETVLHQGDCYLHAVPKNWPRGKVRATRQVALGTSVGSRHVAEGDGVTVYEGAKLPVGFMLPEGAQISDLLGPVIESTDKVATLTHTEHAHHTFPTSECDWQVTYQWDARTMGRVQD